MADASNILQVILNKDVEGKLDAIDKKLDAIRTNTENTVKAIGGLGSGIVEEFTNLSGVLQNIAGTGFQQLNASIASSIDAINRMAQAISGMGQAGAGGGMGGANTILQQIRDNTNAVVAANTQLSAVFTQLNQQYAELLKKTKISAAATFSNADKRKIAAQMTHQQALDELNTQIKITLQKQAQIDAIRRQAREQKALLDAQSRVATFNSTAYGRAMTMSEQTIQARIKKIERLRAVLRELKKDEANHKDEIKAVKQKMNDLNVENQKVIKSLQNVKQQLGGVSTHARSASLSMRDLASAFGVAFSLQSVVNFGKKIVETTGYFELQHRALQAIIQDTDKANALWDKTVKLAVRSPYQIKELVSYTKQLAAYRIETDKLYDTTKMLADISSGLGVDMQRLILAYGQVKAANYLRGQELRQFSEAGVNILGELANYFSELEGRAISTGEVFDMVSKRMVKFEDVSAVLKRLTDEGGIFFNMQEIQAETITGQLANLKDSFDVFLNEIGSNKSGFITDTIQKIKSMLIDVDGLMRTTNFALSVMAARFLAIRVETSIIQKQNAFSLMGKHIGTAIAALQKYIALQRAQAATGAAQNRLLQRSIELEAKLNALRKSGGTIAGGWATIIAAAVVGVVMLYNKLTETERRIKKIGEEAKKTVGTTVQEMNKSIKGYDILVRQIGKTNQGTRQRAALIAKLNSQYGEYLTNQADEATTNEELANSIEEVNKRMKEKAALEAYQNGIEKINSELYKTYENADKNFDLLLKTALGTGEYRTEETMDVESTTRRVQETVNMTSKEAATLREIIRDTVKALEPEAWDEVAEQVEIINKAAREYFGKDGISLIASTDRETDFFKKMREEMRLTKELQDEITAQLPETHSLAANARIESAVKSYQQQVEQIERDTPEKMTATLKATLDNAKRELEKEKVTIKVEFGIMSKEEGDRQKAAIDNWENTFTESYNNAIEKLSDKFSEEEINFMKLDADEQKAGTKEQEKELQAYYDAAIEGEKELLRYKAANLDVDEEMLAELQRRIVLAETMAATRGYDLTKDKKSGGGNTALQTLNKQIEAIKNAAKQYDEYKKRYEDTKAFDKTKESVGDLFKELGISNALKDAKDWKEDSFADNVEKWLNGQMLKAGKDGKIAVKKYVSTIAEGFDEKTFKNSLDVFKKQMEEAISDYNMFSELNKLGIGKDFASILFGVNTNDLKQLRDALDKYKMDNLEEYLGGTETTKAIDEMEKKITEIEDKEQKERLKKYVAYTKQAMTERAKIEVEGLQELSEIEKTFQKEIEKAQRGGNTERAEQIQQLLDAAVEGSKRATNEKLQKQAWEDFKGSDMYVEMFNDIGNASTKVIEAIQGKIGELRKSLKDLNPSDLKAITQEINKLEDEIIKRNPAKAYFDLFKKVRDLKKQGKSEDSLMQQMGVNDADIEGLEKLIAANEKWIKSREQNSEALRREEGDDEYLKMNMSLQSQVEQWKKLIDQKKKDNAITAEELATYKSFRKASQEFANYLQNMGGRVASIFSDIMSNLEAFGGETTNTSEAWGDLFSSLMSIIATIPNYILLMKAAGVAANEALGVVGWIITAVEVLMALIKGVANIKNAQINDEIEGYKDQLEALENAYDRLETAFDRAFSVGKLKQYEAAMEENLEKQVAYYQAMIAAENRRKSPDQDAIDEYKEAINDIYDEIDDRHEKFIEEVGGLSEGGFKDAAQSFVDAWFDAYQETGDGLEGLRDSFDEILQNFVKKQAMLRIAGTILEPLFKQIEAAASDGILSTDEMQRIMAMAEDKFPELNGMLTTFFQSMGMFGENAEGQLDGLQKGIQGVTEDTAEIIAAYLNSLRYYVIDTNTKLGQLVGVFSDVSGQANPMLLELRNIASRTDDIYNFLYQRRESGTDALRVFLVNP